MLAISFNLVLLKSFALQFVEYSVLILVFFLFFVLVNNLLDKAKSADSKEIQLSSN